MPITADGYSMEMDLVTRASRIKGKAPIIFAGVDAFWRQRRKSADSALRRHFPASNETNRDPVEPAARDFPFFFSRRRRPAARRFVSFPSIVFPFFRDLPFPPRRIIGADWNNWPFLPGSFCGRIDCGVREQRRLKSSKCSVPSSEPINRQIPRSVHALLDICQSFIDA